MAKEEKDRVFVNDKTYFINGVFNDEMRSAVVWQLQKDIVELKNTKNAKLTFYISSNGGDGYLCLDIIALFELAKKNGITVRTVVTSHALSAGSMLAVAGTAGERYIANGAEHLPHYGQFDGGRKTTPLQLDRNYEHSKRWNKYMVEHYSKYAEIPDLEEKLKDDDLWIPANKCIKWKLADKYLDEFDI